MMIGPRMSKPKLRVLGKIIKSKVNLNIIFLSKDRIRTI